MTPKARAQQKRQRRNQQQHSIAAQMTARDLSQKNGQTHNVCQVQYNWQFSARNLKHYQHPDTWNMPAIADWLSKDYIRAAKKHGYELARKRISDNIKKVKFSGFNCCWPDERIKEFAKAKAEQVAGIRATFTKRANQYRQPLDMAVVLFQVEIMISDYDIALIETDYQDLDKVACTLARYECQYWWRRQLRKLQFYKLQQLGRDLAIVSHVKQPYCPDLILAYRKVREGQNRELIESMVAVANFEESNQHWVNLADAVDASTANPIIRAAELMVRMRGFEEYAESKGHVGEFVTLTAPSRYHSINKNGQPNKNYVMGVTGKAAHAHLQDNWVKSRALFSKHNIKPYGFRVVEPHHDGCPHWHMLLFMPKGQVGRFRKIMRDQALKDSPREVLHNPGIRIKFKAIDKNKGSAAGYIAKYICKGVNGYKLSHTQDTANGKVINENTADAARRIKANLTANGIRQFQQIGGPPVTVWRELRRLGKGIEGQRTMAFQINEHLKFDDMEHFLLESIRRAADAGDWQAFVIAMGGIGIKRKDRPCQLSYKSHHVLNKLTGQVGPRRTRYGEIAKYRVSGVDYYGMYVSTRAAEYLIMRKADLAEANRKSLEGISMTFDVMEQAERYQAMKEEEYQRHLDMIDQHETLVEQMWILYDAVEATTTDASAGGGVIGGGLDLCH